MNKQEQIKLAVEEYKITRGLLKDISKKYGISYPTLSKHLKENNIAVFKGHKKNRLIKDNFFENINTEEKAYWVGFIFADGSVRVRKDGIKQLRIKIQKQDQLLLEKFLLSLNSDSSFQYYTNTLTNNETVAIEICSQKIVDDLEKIGIISNKTYLSKKLPIVPEEFIIPFLRGLFDGDGILSYKENYNEAAIGYCSYSQEIIVEVQQLIDKLINKTEHNKIISINNSWYCKWRGRRQILRILFLLYNNANIYLDRKYDKYQRLLATVADKDIV